MEDEMSATQIPLTLIVAATVRNGIGRNGGLPWPMLRKEMAYFARVTKRVALPTNTGSVQSDSLKKAILEGTQRNVVIMGRKTWDSIPPKFRPLKERTNIVITSQPRSALGQIPEDVITASDILSGLRRLDDAVRSGQALPPGRAFVIGGASIYNAALALPQTKRILLTRIYKDYDCDTFFPAELGANGSSESDWRPSSRQALEAFVGEELPAENSAEYSGDERVEYAFQLYEAP